MDESIEASTASDSDSTSSPASCIFSFCEHVCALVLRATFGGLQQEPTLNFDVVFAAAAVYIVSKAKCHYSQNPCPRPHSHVL